MYKKKRTHREKSKPEYVISAVIQRYAKRLVLLQWLLIFVCAIYMLFQKNVIFSLCILFIGGLFSLLYMLHLYAIAEIREKLESFTRQNIRLLSLLQDRLPQERTSD